MSRRLHATPALRTVLRIVALAAAHLLVAMATAIVAKGWDLDRLRSRSPVSEAAGGLHDLLMYPHDAALRALPRGFLTHNLHVVPLALLLHSLLWGVALYLVWRAAGATRRSRAA